MRIAAIAAMAQNRVIGKNNQLPWKLSEDLKRFREITMGHALILGRKTYESIGRPLPGRDTIIITRQPHYQVRGATVLASVPAAIQHCQNKYREKCKEELQTQEFQEEILIGGGAEIYKAAFPWVERLYLTLIHQNIDGDAFFPDFDWGLFQEVSRENRQEPLPYSFIVLDRKKT